MQGSSPPAVSGDTAPAASPSNSPRVLAMRVKTPPTGMRPPRRSTNRAWFKSTMSLRLARNSCRAFKGSKLEGRPPTPTWTCSPSCTTQARYPGANRGSRKQCNRGGPTSGTPSNTSSTPTIQSRFTSSARSLAMRELAPSAPTTYRASTQRENPGPSSRSTEPFLNVESPV